jgi:PKD repeat protein
MGSTTHFQSIVPISDSTIIKWLWLFGDGGTASNINPTHKYINPGSYKVFLIVTRKNNSSDTAIQNIIINNPKALFSYDTTTSGEPTFFMNNSTIFTGGSYITTFKWNFGDNSTSSIQNPVHYYKSDGTYNVKLTVIDDVGCTDSIIRIVVVKPAVNINYYKLHGMVFAGNKPAYNAGYVLAFRLENNFFVRIDSCPISPNYGDYAFLKLKEGQYLIKVCETSPLFNDYLPTYYGNKLFWQDATLINLNKDIQNAQIDLKKANISIGTFAISGKVFTQQNNIPLSAISILLIDKNTNNVITNTYTNALGEYRINNIMIGSYYVIADCPSQCNNPIPIEINGNLNVISNTNINMSNCKIGINQQKYITQNTISILQNPVQDNILKIKLSTSSVDNQLTLSIYDITGKNIKTNTYTIPSNENFEYIINIPTEELHSGIYFLSAFFNKSATYSKFKFIKL